MAIFPGEAGLAGFIAVRTMEVMMTTGAITCAELQSNHHHQQTNTQLFTGQMPPPCRPNNSVKALKGKQCQSSESTNRMSINQSINHLLLKMYSKENKC